MLDCIGTLEIVEQKYGGLVSGADLRDYADPDTIDALVGIGFLDRRVRWRSSRGRIYLCNGVTLNLRGVEEVDYTITQSGLAFLSYRFLDLDAKDVTVQ